MSDGVIRKRSVTLAGHRTSISVEDEFWDAFKKLAAKEKSTLTDVLTRIDAARPGNLSSALRLYVLQALQTQR